MQGSAGVSSSRCPPGCGPCCCGVRTRGRGSAAAEAAAAKHPQNGVAVGEIVSFPPPAAGGAAATARLLGRHGVRACLPLGAHGKSERLPGLAEQVVQGCRGVGKGAYEGCKEWVGHGREGQEERGCMQAAAAARARGVSGSWEGRW